MADEKYITMGLDVSTKTIGITIMDENCKLLELTHISPKAKPKPEEKIEELIKKANIFYEFVREQGYHELNVKKLFIEEPLLRSNNVYTIGTLLKFNGMISKICYEVFNVVPEYISTYDSRQIAFPELMEARKFKKNGEPVKKLGKPVLFGGYPYDVDKKQVILDKVSELEPQLVWKLNRNGNLKVENFDMTDSYCVLMAGLRRNNMWTR